MQFVGDELSSSVCPGERPLQQLVTEVPMVPSVILNAVTGYADVDKIQQLQTNSTMVSDLGLGCQACCL